MKRRKLYFCTKCDKRRKISYKEGMFRTDMSCWVCKSHFGHIDYDAKRGNPFAAWKNPEMPSPSVKVITNAFFNK